MALASDGRELLRDLEQQLAHYAPHSFDKFVATGGAGAVYSLERAGTFSLINTATLLRFERDHRQENPELNLISKKLKIDAAEDNLTKELLRLEQEMRDDERPDLAELAAYRAAHILLVIDDSATRKALKAWLLRSIKHWMETPGAYEPSVFVLFLAVNALRDGIASKSMLPAAFELLLSRQIVLAKEANGYFDAVDVALLLAMIDPAQLDVSHLNAAVNALHEATAARGIWTNRKPVVRIGVKTLGCSAIDACVALLTANDCPLFDHLHDSFVAHLRWMLSQNGPWFRSDLLRNERLSETWFNCRAYEFLYQLRMRTDSSLQKRLLERYHARTVVSAHPWKSMILAEPDRVAIENTFIKAAIARSEKPHPKKLDECTAILFGPPGTTKTTIAETVAAEIGWPFIELGVADFLRHGVDRVFERSTEIFGDLSWLRDAVVLLDEVESVFADRLQHVELLQKFLTAALLPPLQRLKKRGEIILVIATNHIGTFDTAISRPGRIDLIIPVGPPDREQRKRLLREQVKLDNETAKALSKLLPDSTTLLEILLFKKVAAGKKKKGAELATALFAGWKDARRTAVITDDALESFRQEADRYRRIV